MKLIVSNRGSVMYYLGSGDRRILNGEATMGLRRSFLTFSFCTDVQKEVQQFRFDLLKMAVTPPPHESPREELSSL
jgi:hypothetical protein